MKKKKVGILYGRPLIEGDVNYIKPPEILVKQENESITLAERGNRGMKSISDQSSAEDKWGDVRLIMSLDNSSVLLIIDSYYNPKTLKEIFCFLPTISAYTSESLNIDSVSYTATMFTWEMESVVVTPHYSWIGKEDTVNLFKKLTGIYATYKVLNFKGMLPLMYFRIPYASFSNGKLKGIYSTGKNKSLISIRGVSSSFYFCHSNYKGEDTNDIFSIAGNTSKTTIDDAMDESYVVVENSLLVASPLVDGLFAIALHNKTGSLVLIKCLDVDMSYYREQLNIPKSMVISYKEGEYIEYPNIQEANTDAIMTTELPYTDSTDESKNFLLKTLEQMVESMNATIKRLKGEEG